MYIENLKTLYHVIIWCVVCTWPSNGFDEDQVWIIVRGLSLQLNEVMISQDFITEARFDEVWWGMMRYSEVCESLQLWLRFYNSYLKRMLSVVRELSMTKFPWDLELLTLRVWCGMQYIYYIYMSLWSATWDSGPESGQEMVKLVDLMIMFMNTTIYWWMNTTIYLGCWTANNYDMSILC